MSFNLTVPQKKDILVVDDAPENLNVLLHALSEAGYSVRCARSGNLAITGSQAIPPDLVLLDILMPQMDGYEVCRRLKQDARTDDVPIIFLSVLDDGSDKSRAFAMGGSDYIAKPFDIEEVLARVKYQLSLKQRRVRLQHRAARFRQISYDFREAYTFQREILDSLTEGVATFQPVFNDAGVVRDFQAVIANPAFLRLLNRDAGATRLADETLQTLTAHYDDCELLNVCWRVFEFDESCQRELLCSSDGQQQWFEVFATKLRDGIVLSLHDITNAKTQISTLEIATQELYTLATTDGLTQISNRYQFESYFATEWQRSVREQKPLSILMVDIDQFKRFNDICGHSVGDRCLQAVAQVLQSVMKRPTDFVARYGGEEFAIVLPNTPLRGATQIARDVQSEVRNLRLTDVSSVECEQVNVSIGIGCTLPQIQLNSRMLLEIADRALYNAKALGGNTICVEMI